MDKYSHSGDNAASSSETDANSNVSIKMLRTWKVKFIKHLIETFRELE